MLISAAKALLPLPDTDRVRVMPAPFEPRDAAPEAVGCFATTHWSVVCSAAQTDSIEAREALETLCRTYWYPVYAFVRRQGNNSHDAEDLTQEFFARLLEKNTFAAADRRRGKFRSFLLSSLKNFMTKEWQRGQAQKRGGGQILIPLAEEAEHRYALEAAQTPGSLFERRWALTLLERVLAALQHEFRASGKESLFDALKPALMGEGRGIPYAEIAATFSMTESAIKVAVHRLRARYRELLFAEIAHTVATPAEVEEELRHLFAAVST